MQEKTQEYIRVLNDCLQKCQQMLSFEQKKRKALLNSNEENLASILQAQQATIMKLEGIEKNRIAAQHAAGFGDMTAEEIVNSVQDLNEREMLSSLFTELRNVIKELQELNKISMDIARNNLKIVETLLHTQYKDETLGVYSPTKTISNEWQSGASFEEKV